MKNEIEKVKALPSVNNRDDNQVVVAELDCGRDGKVLPTTTNYQYILRDDPKYLSLFGYDSFANKILCFENGGKHIWSDADDAKLRCDIEERYGIYNQQKYYDAFNKVAKERSFNPLQEPIDTTIEYHA